MAALKKYYMTTMYFKDGLLWLSHDQILRLPKDQREMRYINTPAGFFDKLVYSKRLRLSMIPFLLDVNDTAKNARGKANVKISGWGLEKSKATLEQRNLFVIELFSVITALEKAGLISELYTLTLAGVKNSFPRYEKSILFDAEKIWENYNSSSAGSRELEADGTCW